MVKSTVFTKFINKRISRSTKFFTNTYNNMFILFIRMVAYLSSLFSRRIKKRVAYETLETRSKEQIVLNCLGTIDLQGNLDTYEKDLKEIKGILSEADVSLASSRFGKNKSKAYSNLGVKLRANRIVDVSYGNDFIKSTIYKTQVGNIAVCSSMLNYQKSRKRHVRLELVKEYFVLKKMKADYVIFYIDSKQLDTVSEKNKQLCELLLRSGVDYIVNVKPDMIDSGITYLQRNRSVSRAIYSIGTFLSDREARPQNRVGIRIKLRNVKGKLQAYEEAYYPFYYSNASGLVYLTAASKKVKELAVIEKSMPRMRSVERLITVGDIVEVVGAEIPEKFSYIKDFSVGRVLARPLGYAPGDLYIRWQPHTDANDEDTYEYRVSFARKSAIRVSKTVLFVISYKDFTYKSPYVVVEDGLEADSAIGAYIRKQLDFRCVAVTGSIGKTSTKDMLAEVMKMKYNTVKSEKNGNIHSKMLPLLQKVTSDCEVYIQELGGGRPGGASRHSRMVLPEATVVTNIGDAHIGNFDGDQIALMNNKLQIIDGMPENGIIYLNGDDPLLGNAEVKCKKILFAVHNKQADYYADNLVTAGDKTYFDIVHGEKKVSACVLVPGEHNVLNAICCYAIGKQFGISDSLIVKGLRNFKTQGIRQNIVNASGMKLFFDCYNASSGSFASSIKTLQQIAISENSKRVAVLGDITGLGDLAESTHKEIAQTLIENPADVFLFYGKNIKFTYEIVCQHNLKAYYTPDFNQLVQWLSEIAKPGDAVMAKASSKMQLEYAFDCAFGTRSFDSAMIDENQYFRARVGGIAYNLFNTHVTAVKPEDEKETIQVKKKVGVLEVRNIASSFGSSILKTVILPDTIRHIGIRAFKNCTNLKKIEGAQNAVYIGMAAFKNCESLEYIELPKTLKHIGNDAFYGCTALKEVYIPESVVQIGLRAFEGCPNLKITCKAGSYAESYLKQYNYEYTCV